MGRGGWREGGLERWVTGGRGWRGGWREGGVGEVGGGREGGWREGGLERWVMGGRGWRGGWREGGVGEVGGGREGGWVAGGRGPPVTHLSNPPSLHPPLPTLPPLPPRCHLFCYPAAPKTMHWLVSPILLSCSHPYPPVNSMTLSAHLKCHWSQHPPDPAPPRLFPLLPSEEEQNRTDLQLASGGRVRRKHQTPKCEVGLLFLASLALQLIS